MMFELNLFQMVNHQSISVRLCFLLKQKPSHLPNIGRSPPGVWRFPYSKSIFFHLNVSGTHAPSYPFIRPFIEVITPFITIVGAHLQAIEKKHMAMSQVTGNNVVSDT